MTKYFECKPTILCKGADCCTTPETKPALSVGDYLRLSWFTQEPVVDIWRNKGDIAVNSFPDLKEGHFLVSLSLLHDPCPYLSKEYKCAVHETRPLGCGSFPIMLFKRKSQELEGIYNGYRCLQNVQPRPEQLQLTNDLEQILKEEAELDIRFFWEGSPVYINASTVGAFSELALEALRSQKTRDPQEKYRRTQTLIRALDRMQSIIEEKKGVHLSAIEYSALLSPVMFAILEERVAQRLENLPSEAIEAYKKTTEQWLKLAGKIE